MCYMYYSEYKCINKLYYGDPYNTRAIIGSVVAPPPPPPTPPSILYSLCTILYAFMATNVFFILKS